MHYRLAVIREVRNAHHLAKLHGASRWRVMCVFGGLSREYVIYEKENATRYDVVDFIEATAVLATGVNWEAAAEAMMARLQTEHMENAR